MDRLVALRVFHTIVQQGSFAAAARQLGLSPAAVSKNIAELEASLGSRLLNRTTRRLSLTEAGERYADRVGRILEDLEDADHELADLSGGVLGRLRVGAPLTLGLKVLSPALPAFLRRHPRLTLDLDLDDRQVDIIREGFDLVLRGGPALDDSRLIARKVATLRYVVCASPDYMARHPGPTRPEAVADHTLVQFSLPRRSGPWVYVRDRERVDVPVQPCYTVNSSLAIRDAVMAGVGIGRMPELYVRDDLAAGRLIEILPDWSTGALDVFAVYPSRHHLPPKTRVFLDLVANAFGASAPPA